MDIRTFFAYDPADTANIRVEKFASLLVASACCLAGCVWTVMYYVIFGWTVTSVLPLLFVLIVGTALVISHYTRNHYYAIYAQIVCIIYIPAWIQWTIGSVFDSGVVLAWAFLGPLCALMFFSLRQSLVWFGLYQVNLFISVFFNDYFVANGLDVSQNTRLFFFGMNMGVASTVVFLFASYYVTNAIQQQRKANRLLRANLQQDLALRESEKLATLGKLSAGVAHELNNPAAATQRGAEQLQDVIGKLEEAEFRLGQANLSTEQLQVLASQSDRIDLRAQQPLDLDPLARSDQEYEIETWLEDRGVEDAWEYAPLLVNIGYSCANLTQLGNHFGGAEIPIVTALLSHRYATRNLLQEIGQGAGRITEIVKALKSYTYLDQAPVQAVDIHEGLDNTLIILRSKLKAGVNVHREYAADLPRIEAYGSELNQVWTNIIDNAVGAMHGQGDLTLRTYQQDGQVVVEIVDTGPGIPAHVQSHIFDPFFTTKAPGEGTGLGLNISHNIIVHKHNGTISVSSRPGETCFRITLPLNFQRHENGDDSAT